MMLDERDVEELLARLEHFPVDSDLKKARQGVFDAHTLRALHKAMERGYLSRIVRIIAAGKEADVFLGEMEDGIPVAVKIYRVDSSRFIHLRKYIEGDPRFSGIKRRRRFVIKLWVKKEFKNLETAFKFGVSVPYPVFHIENVLIMEFIGNGGPAPLLKNVSVSDGFYESLLDTLALLYFRAGLIHADLSEYNILVRENMPVVIDMGQSVPWDHPMSHEFFLRDMQQLLKIVGRYASIGELVNALRERAGIC